MALLTDTYTNQIVGTLSCFDRIVITGTLADIASTLIFNEPLGRPFSQVGQAASNPDDFGQLIATTGSKCQGQRTLNSLCRQYLHQVLVAPAGYAALALDAILGRMALQQTDGEAAQPGEIGGHTPFPRATAVLVKDHIQNPVVID